MGLIIIIASLTLATSFLCSLFEAALYAVSPSQLELLKKRKVRGAQRLARLRTDAEESIAAILTVNTIAHTIGAAWCGALVAAEYGDDAFGWFAAIFTFLVLALTEIVPKSVGFRFAMVLGPRVAWPLQVMVWLSWPIARPARWAMRALTGGEPQHGPTEEEILVFSRMAAKQGKVRNEEHEWVKNALRLDQTTAGSLRTPRPVVNLLPLELTIGAASAQQMDQVHSRVPIVAEIGSDEVVGMVYRRELLEHVVRGHQDKPLADILHPIRHVPESMPGHALMRVFLRDRKHMVAVVDEYGSFEGIVTLEDVLEALLGEEIVDEHDEVVDMQAHARQQRRDR
ncbi:MAG: hypothetical protein CMJ94_13995 [Planctomycetes bacterium]|nr:hypothetical protein [Planctomycetota bacterium]